MVTFCTVSDSYVVKWNHILNPDLTFHSMFGKEGSGTWGVACDCYGNVCMADGGNKKSSLRGKFVMTYLVERSGGGSGEWGCVCVW